MAKKYIPEFPFKKSQFIFQSDRIVIYSKSDAIFLFGKAAIGLSSPGRINIDSKEGTTINAPEIELGLNARTIGEPVVKANTTILLLQSLLNDLSSLSEDLSNISKTGFETSVVRVVTNAKKLKGTCDRVKGQLNNIKSNITFTR